MIKNIKFVLALLIMFSAITVVAVRAGISNESAERDVKKVVELEGFVKARPIECGQPVYPEESRRLGEEGKVGFNIWVTAEGHADEVKLALSSGFPRLDEAAREFLSACKFSPATRDGKPVAGWLPLRHVWKIGDDLSATEQSRQSTDKSIKLTAAAPPPVDYRTAISNFCQGAVKGYGNSFSALSDELGEQITDSAICDCTESRSKKDKYLKLLYEGNAPEAIEGFDPHSWSTYYFAKTSEYFFECMSKELHKAATHYSPKKKS